MTPLLLSLCFAAPDFQAGVATVVITPAEPMWMAGYAHRNKPAEGKAHDLHAKALAITDAGGTTLVLLTTDLIGLPRDLAADVTADVMKRTGLKRDQLMLSSSHTHSGPVVRGNLTDMYPLTPAEAAKVNAYSVRLRKDLADVMVKAVESRKPARLRIGEGTAGFAVNRRQETAKGVVLGVNPAGPTDRRVPVLEVTAADGKRLAVVFGYACHNTTLDYYKWSGDYAGYSQLEVEKAIPGAVALYWIGCGADANPNPRRTEELAKRHGQELAAGVVAALKGELKPVSGRFAARYSAIPLPYAELPNADKLKAELLSKQPAAVARARRLLADLEKGPLPTTYPAYPVQTWRVGDGLVWVALGGEVVVDYALRLRKELPLAGRDFWAAGYANDVMAYIASARVLKEGGYEADSSMIYYGLPSRWASAVEERIVTEVTKQVRELDATR